MSRQSEQAAPQFGDRYTVFPETGIVQIHCYTCGKAWDVDYHPSLDVLIEQAGKHEAAVHA